MIWEIVQKVVGYLFTLAILYICSQTLLQWNDTRKMEMVKDEIRKEFAAERRDLQKQVYYLEIRINEFTISQKDRMDAIEETNKKDK